MTEHAMSERELLLKDVFINSNSYDEYFDRLIANNISSDEMTAFVVKYYPDMYAVFMNEN